MDITERDVAMSVDIVLTTHHVTMLPELEPGYKAPNCTEGIIYSFFITNLKKKNISLSINYLYAFLFHICVEFLFHVK